MPKERRGEPGTALGRPQQRPDQPTDREETGMPSDPTGAGTRRRATRVVVGGLLASLALAVLPGQAAADRRVYPSAGDVTASRARVAGRAAQVGRIEASLAAASARAQRLAVDV